MGATDEAWNEVENQEEWEEEDDFMAVMMANAPKGS